MEQIQQQIRWLHTGYSVSFSFCILFMLLSIVLFFRFRILKIINTWTGRSVRKRVQEMEERYRCDMQTNQKVFMEDKTEELSRPAEDESGKRGEQDSERQQGMFQMEKHILYIHAETEIGEEVVK